MPTLLECKQSLRKYEQFTGGRNIEARRFLNQLHIASIQGGFKLKNPFKKKKKVAKPIVVGKPQMNELQRRILANQLQKYSAVGGLVPAGRRE